MATKAPLSLYAEDPEDQEIVQQYRDSQKMLLDSLENRKQLFDPTLLAMAQGFLSPTKTGSFGEALGNVAAQVAPVQEAENKRAQELAKMRFDMAQQNLAQSRATRGEKEFRGLVDRIGGGEAKVPSGPPVAGDAFMPSREPQAVVNQATQGSRDITSADIARLANTAPEKAKILQDMIKMDQDRYAISMNGIVFDKKTRKYLNLEIPGQKQEAFTTPYGTFQMTPYEYSQFKNAASDGRGQEWIDSFRGKPKAAPGAPGAATPMGRPTVAETAAEAEAAKIKATKTATGEVERTQDAINAGMDTTGRLATYSALRGIASRPDASQIFGIFNRPDISTAILNLVQEGVQSPGTTTIRAGALEDTLRNVGLPQDQIDRYRFALQQMANVQLQQAKLAAGQGSVSNFERDLFASASISPKDPPQTILAKLSMLEARANFDRRRAAALRKSKMDLDDFVDTDEGQKLTQDYLAQISRIASNFGSRAPAAQRGAPQTKPSQPFVYRGTEKKD